MNTPSAQSSRASLRLRVRMGDLARNRRPDPDGAIEQREPDELMEAIDPLDAGTHDDASYGAAADADRARCATGA